MFFTRVEFSRTKPGNSFIRILVPLKNRRAFLKNNPRDLYIFMSIRFFVIVFLSIGGVNKIKIDFPLLLMHYCNKQIHMDFQKEIAQKRSEMASLIRQYSRSQKELWQQVPYLALQANGRGGFSEHYSRCYSQGYWIISSSSNHSGGGFYTVIVNCETGELVYPHKKEPASDHFLMNISIEELDASKVIKDLKKHATWKNSEMIHFDDHTCKTPEEWRKKQAKKYGVKKKSYKRPEEIRKMVTAG